MFDRFLSPTSTPETLKIIDFSLFFNVFWKIDLSKLRASWVSTWLENTSQHKPVLVSEREARIIIVVFSRRLVLFGGFRESAKKSRSRCIRVVFILRCCGLFGDFREASQKSWRRSFRTFQSLRSLRSLRSLAHCARSASCKHLPNILEPSLAFLIYKLFFITLGVLGTSWRRLGASVNICWN